MPSADDAPQLVDLRSARHCAHSARRSSRCRRRAPAPRRRPGGSSRRGRRSPACRRRAPWPPSACGRRRAMVPGFIRPASIRLTKATRGSARLPVITARSASGQRPDGVDALPRGVDIDLLALDADEMAAEPLGHRAGRAGAEERIEHDVARLGRGQHDARQQRFRLLRRVQLVAIVVLQPLARRCRSETASRSASARRRWTAFSAS